MPSVGARSPSLPSCSAPSSSSTRSAQRQRRPPAVFWPWLRAVVHGIHAHGFVPTGLITIGTAEILRRTGTRAANAHRIVLAGCREKAFLNTKFMLPRTDHVADVPEPGISTESKARQRNIDQHTFEIGLDHDGADAATGFWDDIGAELVLYVAFSQILLDFVLFMTSYLTVYDQAGYCEIP